MFESFRDRVILKPETLLGRLLQHHYKSINCHSKKATSNLNCLNRDSL